MVKISHEEFKMFATYIKEQYGIYLKEEKKDLLVGRLHHILDKMEMKNFTQYYKHLMSDSSGEATNLFIDRITTNHTYFMREASHFQCLMEEILPYWTGRITDRDLRIWCAACSSGEEAYTIAMVINDFLGKEKVFWDAKILATDLSKQILDKAQSGVYKKEDVMKLPIPWQKEYFNPISNQLFAVDPILKKEVIFRQFNLMTTQYPFKRKFHIIFCRNVMIYFDEETRRKVLSKFYEALEPGGYLLIGKSESLGTGCSGFRYVHPSIYQKV